MSPVSLRASLVAAVVAVATAQIPREFAKNVTVYHVNPVVYGVAPVNMNTADLFGDMYFDLRTKALPIEVRDAPPMPPETQVVHVGNSGGGGWW
jgi:fumarate reductase subunit C